MNYCYECNNHTFYKYCTLCGEKLSEGQDDMEAAHFEREER